MPSQNKHRPVRRRLKPPTGTTTSLAMPIAEPMDSTDRLIASRMRIPGLTNRPRSTAAKMGVKLDHFHEVMWGKARPSARFVMDFCRVLRVSPSAILRPPAKEEGDEPEVMISARLRPRNFLAGAGQRLGKKISRTPPPPKRKASRTSPHRSALIDEILL